ncbi:hypothetical protein [Clostridium butyricum]|nr:hypothetical protein [Clostridium butyricum]EDT77110.1 hypothetical protein CBY_1186 [Clostridium butyricum 5521]
MRLNVRVHITSTNGKIKRKIEECWFDEEVLIHFINALKGPDKENYLMEN